MTKSDREFDGRVFLTEDEWRTYMRRRPVRYIKKCKTVRCEICGKEATEDNPLQNAHRIGFTVGIQRYGLTPEFLDSDRNIITAHRGTCNKQAELDDAGVMAFLEQCRVSDLPSYMKNNVKTRSKVDQALALVQKMTPAERADFNARLAAARDR